MILVTPHYYYDNEVLMILIKFKLNPLKLK